MWVIIGLTLGLFIAFVVAFSIIRWVKMDEKWLKMNGMLRREALECPDQEWDER